MLPFESIFSLGRSGRETALVPIASKELDLLEGI